MATPSATGYAPAPDTLHAERAVSVPVSMATAPTTGRDHWNGARWPTGRGHYESWFVRANHPTRPLAFWIRYTIFAPADAPDRAEGELWAVWFDGERDRVVAATSKHPIADCRFEPDRLGVRIAGATLDDDGLAGTCQGAEARLAWSLAVEDGARPLLLLPESSYTRGFPRAKALVARPSCRFSGTVEVDGTPIDIVGWLGSQNHNWGSAHTDRYAWGQVAGFDGREDAVLECASARVRIGPVSTPWLTAVVLRLGDEEIACNGLVRSALASVELDGLRWELRTTNGRDRLRVTMTAAPEAFVGLTYRNPPGGTKTCLNSKIAACELALDRPGRARLTLRTAHRAAFELLGLGTRGVAVSP
jgi:hypothetical protein